MTFPQPAARRELIDELERRSGVALKNRADVDAYVAKIRATAAHANHRTRTWIALRQGVLALGLVLAFLQYYLIDVYVQIVSLPSVTFIAPSQPDVAVRPAAELVLLLFS